MRISNLCSVRVSIAIFIGVITAMSTDGALAQAPSNSRFLIMPSIGFASPTSRFGEVQASESSEDSKAGHKDGYSFGGDVGLYLAEYLAVGVRYNRTRLDIEFPDVQSAPDPDSLELARTTIDLGQLWIRVFPAGASNRWKPYVVIGAGSGRPQSETKTLRGTGEKLTIVSTVSKSFAFSAGAGVFVPLSSWAKIAFEFQYQEISANGSDIEECFSGLEGVEEICVVSRKAKSNTTWWEIRGGIVFTM